MPTQTAARTATPPVRQELNELSLLFEISQTLDRALDLREAVGPVLGAMARHMGMVRGTIALLNREMRQITIEAAYGLSASQQERGRYRLGEGGPGPGRTARGPGFNSCQETISELWHARPRACLAQPGAAVPQPRTPFEIVSKAGARWPQPCYRGVTRGPTPLCDTTCDRGVCKSTKGVSP